MPHHRRFQSNVVFVCVRFSVICFCCCCGLFALHNFVGAVRLLERRERIIRLLGRGENCYASRDRKTDTDPNDIESCVRACVWCVYRHSGKLYECGGSGGSVLVVSGHFVSHFVDTRFLASERSPPNGTAIQLNAQRTSELSRLRTRSTQFVPTTEWICSSGFVGERAARTHTLTVASLLY